MEKREKQGGYKVMNLNKEAKIFDIVLLIILSVFIIMSFSFSDTARVFPLYFGLICFFFVLANLIVNSMKNPPKFLKFIKQKGTLSGMKSPTEEANELVESIVEEEENEEISWKEIMKIVVWLIAYIIGLATINYLLATFLFLALFLGVAGKVSWINTLLISVGFTGFLYFLFEVIL
jgi:uncharacterized membrane protein